MSLHISEHNGTEQARAAEALSKVLTDLGVRHAFIGGFARALLGNDRPTAISTIVFNLYASFTNVPEPVRCRRHRRNGS